MKNENKQSVTFTDDQSAAIDELISFIAATWSDKDFIRGLCGPGGTGKTFVTKYIIENCKYSHSVIKCTAPTHKACRVLSNSIGNIRNVETIQSTFGLRLDLKLENFDPERPQFNPIAGPKLDNIKLLIIDEASMLPAKLVKYIINTCKKLNIKIIFCKSNICIHIRYLHLFQIQAANLQIECHPAGSSDNKKDSRTIPPESENACTFM